MGFGRTNLVKLELGISVMVWENMHQVGSVAHQCRGSGDITSSAAPGVSDWHGARACDVALTICFTPGAMIRTDTAERPIETLRPGDRVITRDNGVQQIRWIGQRRVSGYGDLAPVSIGANVVEGARAALLVSPHHRILYTGYVAELLFGEVEVLVAAKDLIDGKDVQRRPCDQVTYIHLMFDRHEVIYANGMATESFLANDLALSGLADATRDSLFATLPDLRSARAAHLAPARPCLALHEAQLLSRAMASARRPI
jgi:hypothetical protein